MKSSGSYSGYKNILNFWTSLVVCLQYISLFGVSQDAGFFLRNSKDMVIHSASLFCWVLANLSCFELISQTLCHAYPGYQNGQLFLCCCVLSGSFTGADRAKPFLTQGSVSCVGDLGRKSRKTSHLAGSRSRPDFGLGCFSA